MIRAPVCAAPVCPVCVPAPPGVFYWFKNTGREAAGFRDVPLGDGPGTHATGTSGHALAFTQSSDIAWAKLEIQSSRARCATSTLLVVPRAFNYPTTIDLRCGRLEPAQAGRLHARLTRTDHPPDDC